MECLRVCLLLFCLMATCRAPDPDDREQNGNEIRSVDEKRLLDHLMRGYEKDVRPVRNASHPIVVRVGTTLTQIFDMDEKNQVLTTNVWLDQEWHDELLTWNPPDFGDLKTIRLPCERLWLPDIVLYNNADDYTRGYMNSKAMVGHDGNVFWPPPTKFRSTCPVDVTYFPFDDQKCVLKLGSWTYDGFQVDVTNRTSEVDLSNYVENGEWDLLEARIIRNVVYYSCCPEPFPDVTITIIIRRKTLYYMYNVVLPCMMMSVLTLLVFCLPPDSGEKIALGITVLLAFSVFMLAIAEKMPETSESIPLIGIYLTAVMAITSISVIMTVIVLNFHYRGPTMKEVPSWLRRCFLSERGCCYCCGGGGRMRRPPDSAAATNGARNRRTARLDGSLREERRGFPYSECGVNSITVSKNDSFKVAMDAMQEELKEGTMGLDLGSSDDVGNDVAGCFHHQSTGGGKRKTYHSNSCRGGDSGGPSGTSSAGYQVQEQLLKTLRYMINRQEHEDEFNRAVNEWRQIAQMVDRVLFWIFFVVTTVSSLLFLVILPLEKRKWWPERA